MGGTAISTSGLTPTPWMLAPLGAVQYAVVYLTPSVVDSGRTVWMLARPKVFCPTTMARLLSCSAAATISAPAAVPPSTSTARGRVRSSAGRRRTGSALPMASAEAAAATPTFERITTVAQLDAALASTDRPVMLDFYADWCVACKEMEHLTFADPAIAARLRQARLLQADVTANSADAKALLKRFQLFGPPGILFFDAKGRELAAARTIGFLPADEFAQRLDRAKL